MITEQDIFNYVFFAHLLGKESIQEIEKGENYADTLRFYNSIKEYIEDELPFELKKKISLKIPSYKLKNKFLLHAVNDEKFFKKKVVHFAAASAKENEEIIAKTFLDKGKNYLIRFVRKNSESKVYVFSTKNEIMQNFKIVAYPANLTIQVKDNSEPIIFSATETPDYFELIFN